MEPQNNTPVHWNFEKILLSHNFLNKPIEGFNEADTAYIKDCIELNFNKILNGGVHPDSKISKLMNLFMKLSIHNALKLPKQIEAIAKEYITMIQEFYTKNKEKYEWMSRFMLLAHYVMMGLFLKENWLGKSFLYHDADHRLKKEGEEKLKKIGMEERIKKRIEDPTDYDALMEEVLGYKLKDESLSKYTFKYIKSEEVILQKSPDMLEYLTVDGEEIFRKLSYINLFIILKEYTKNIDNILGDHKFISTQLWRARLNFLHNKILNEKFTSLQQSVHQDYDQFFEKTKELFKDDVEILVTLKVEYGNVQLYYYRYDQSLMCFNEAQLLRELDIKFTGILGVRTKYQSFDTAQLVVNATPKEKSQEEKEVEELKEHLQPKTVKLDELDDDNILLERPKLKDLNMENIKKNLKVYDQIIVLSLIYHLQKTTPKDDILQEQVSAYLRSIMDQSQNWLVYSMALFVKSLNEMSRWKTKERSIAQLQVLVEQFNDKDPKPYERVKYYYSLYYPSYLEMQREMAEKYMEIGMVMSSSKLYEKLDMFEECVECLAMSQRKDEAMKKALEMIEKNPTAKIICIYGELSADHTYFKKAWKFSKKKFARAKRMEARYWLIKNEPQKAIKAFKKALGVNNFHASTWFTLGCTYLKVKDFQEAAVAFGKVVQIDSSQGEAWANLAAALNFQGKKKEAFSSLQQAVKHNEGNWKIWQNFMMVSLEVMKFKSFIEAIQKLIELQQRDVIDDAVLKKVNQIFKFQIQNASAEDAVSVTFYRKKIMSLYKFMEYHMAPRHYFWIRFQEFIQDHREFNIKAVELVQSLEKKEGVNKTYIETAKERVLDTLKPKEIRELMAELCLKECHSIMVVGWEIDKKQCTLLREAMNRLKDAYHALGDEKKSEELNMFVKTNTPIISKTLDG